MPEPSKSAVPTATYRIQLTPAFGFAAAAGLADYLARLGVSHVYLSPILQATPGSQHGYDVIDHTRISEELGGEDGFRAMADAFHAQGLRIVVDIVPNHMAMPNPLADSVIEQGAASPYARFFDIDGERPTKPGWGEPNYRRFFDISGLIGLRQEDPEVFEHTHALVLRLVGEGLIDGLRVDHPDGLTDPAGYLERLAARAPGAWIVAEKILALDEPLPETWPVAGTTGYDALNQVYQALLNPQAEATLTDFHNRFTGESASFRQVEEQAKRYVLGHGLQPELNRLLKTLRPLQPDYTDDALRESVVELLVGMVVYRVYVVPGTQPDAHAGTFIAKARDRAAERLPRQLHGLLDRVAFDALGVNEGSAEFAVRFQQTSAALAAKGVEDTAFYRYTRFAALNEVGGAPATFGISTARFHAYNTRIAKAWPATMTSLSTHDTKRQEDVRARLAVLTELPLEWITAVRQWREGGTPLERSLEYLLWQTLAGAWPLSQERAVEYITKAMREAKTRTSWIDQDQDYENAVFAFVREALANSELTEAIERFVERVTPYARTTSLSQKLLQLTMPGVPDIYQGAELVDLGLVDPDNRRPVDFARRRALLARLDAGEPPRDLDEEKLLVTSRAVRLRRGHPDWFAEGYEPITTLDDHLLAFRRGGAITVVTRLPYGLEQRGGWGESRLPLGTSPGDQGTWEDALTGALHKGSDVALADLLTDLPVALLVRRS